MAQSSVASDPVSTGITPLAVDPHHTSLKWLLLWSLTPAGECACPEGTYRRSERGHAVGGPRSCGSAPGKHPWTPGFPRGAADAASREEVISRHGEPGMARRWGVTLQDVLLLDIDSPRAMRSFCRLAHTLPSDKLLGLAATPRGWHVYLDCPGWTQRAVNTWMRAWLQDWHGTDEAKIGWQGYLLDVRTGAHRYAVWPGECPTDPARRWASAAEFKDAMVWTRWRLREDLLASPEGAPWNTEMTPEVKAKIKALEDTAVPAVRGRPVSSGPIGKSSTMADLERWCAKLAGMERDSGRNNMLNQIAFYQGAAAIRAGHDPVSVQRMLLEAARACGCPGAEATLASGLRSGAGQFAKAS